MRTASFILVLCEQIQHMEVCNTISANSLHEMYLQVLLIRFGESKLSQTCPVNLVKKKTTSHVKYILQKPRNPTGSDLSIL